MAAQRLSKEAETKITDSLGEVAELVNSGLSPNEAISKTASANGVPVGHLELMVRAYNTGRSEAQRQSGEDPMEKLAEFELADLKTVIGLVYPDSIKTASSMLKEAAISDIYKYKPASKSVELKPLAKLASDKGSYAAMPKDQLGNTRAVSSLIEKMGRNVEKLRMDSANNKDKMMEGISKLASYFRTFGSVPFSVAKDNSSKLFGKKAAALLDILSGSNKALKKQAGTVAEANAAVDIKCEPYRTIQECMELASTHINKKAAAAYISKDINSAISSAFAKSLPVDYTGSVMDGIKTAAEDDSEGGSGAVAKGLGRLTNRSNQIAGGMYSASKDLLNTKGPESNADAIGNLEFKNDQMVQDLVLKNIRASTALSDLMANDDVIGAHHPEDVAFHFNEVSHIAPDASSNPAIMRPLLRKRLEGGNAAIDPSDVQQMLDIEKTRAHTSNFRKKLNSSGGSDVGL
jgi:hypothetical protein